VAVLRELAERYGEDAPPGLHERITALLAATPAGWPDQACALEIEDAAAEEVVHALVRRERGLPDDTGLARQQGASVAEAEEIVRDHQRPPRR
jgi:hypothetical protein